MKELIDDNKQYLDESKKPWSIEDITEAGPSTKAMPSWKTKSTWKATLRGKAEICTACGSTRLKGKGNTIRNLLGLDEAGVDFARIELHRYRSNCKVEGCGMAMFAQLGPYQEEICYTPSVCNKLYCYIMNDIAHTLTGFADESGLSESTLSKILAAYLENLKLDEKKSPVCQTVVFFPFEHTRKECIAVLGVLKKDHPTRPGQTVLLDILRDGKIGTIEDFIKRRTFSTAEVEYVYTGLDLADPEKLAELFPSAKCIAVLMRLYKEKVTTLLTVIDKHQYFGEDARDFIKAFLEKIKTDYYLHRMTEMMEILDDFIAGNMKKYAESSSTLDETGDMKGLAVYKKDWKSLKNNYQSACCGDIYLLKSGLSLKNIQDLENILCRKTVKHRMNFQLLRTRLLYQHAILLDAADLTERARFLSCDPLTARLVADKEFFVPMDELRYVFERMDHLESGMPYRRYSSYFNDWYWNFVESGAKEFYDRFHGQNEEEYQKWLCSKPLFDNSYRANSLYTDLDKWFWDEVNRNQAEYDNPFGELGMVEAPIQTHVTLLHIEDEVMLSVREDCLRAALEE